MDQPIARRDFINGAAVVLGGALLVGTTLGEGRPEIGPSHRADDTDSGATAHTDVAIDQAYGAAQELLTAGGVYETQFESSLRIT